MKHLSPRSRRKHRFIETSTGLSDSYELDGGSDKYRIGVYPGTYKVYFCPNYTGVVEGGITDLGLIGTVTVKNNTTYDIQPAPAPSPEISPTTVR